MGLGSPRGHLSERKSRALCQRFPFLHSASSAARRASHAVCVFISPSPAQAASAPVTRCLLRDSQAIEGPLCAASSVPISYEKQPRAVTCTGTAPSPSPRGPLPPRSAQVPPPPRLQGRWAGAPDPVAPVPGSDCSQTRASRPPGLGDAQDPLLPPPSGPTTQGTSSLCPPLSLIPKLTLLLPASGSWTSVGRDSHLRSGCGL